MRDLPHWVQNFQEVAKGAHEMGGKSFKMKHKVAGDAEQRSFQAEVAKELYRLANAPASDYEVIHSICKYSVQHVASSSRLV